MSYLWRVVVATEQPSANFATLRANALAETGLPAPKQHLWTHALAIVAEQGAQLSAAVTAMKVTRISLLSCQYPHFG